MVRPGSEAETPVSGWSRTPRRAPETAGPMPLRNRDARQHDGTERVVELGRLRHAGRRDHVDQPSGRSPAANVQCGSALAVAQTPNRNGCGVGWKPRAWSPLKPSWPVSTTVKPQPGPGVPSDRLRDGDGDEAGDGVRRDPDRAERRARRVDVALAEALHLDQATPGERRRDREVARRVRGGRRGRDRRRARGRRCRRAARRAGCRTSRSGHASAAGRSRSSRRRRPGTPGCRRRPP